jgi:hypothetical protein
MTVEELNRGWPSDASAAPTRNRLANGSEIEAAEASRGTRPLHQPRPPTRKSRRNALRCFAVRVVTTIVARQRRRSAAMAERYRDNGDGTVTDRVLPVPPLPNLPLAAACHDR